jgi:diacylglycerol kinase family enzyme
VHFFDSAGWGLSARVLSRRNQDRRAINALGPLDLIYRDHAVYAGAFLRTFLESYVVDDRMHATVVLDGVRHELEGITDLIIKNTRVYAGAWVFDKASRHDDGVFEVVPFRGKRDWTSKAIIDLEGNPLTEPMRSEIGVQRSEPMRAANIELELTMPERGATLAAQLDGEEWPASPRVFVDVLPRALRVLVP